jgi:ABC-2 type transport system permease protein
MSGRRGRQAVTLVARREITQKLREKSFLISMAVTVAIIVAVAALPPLFGAGDPKQYTLGATDAESQQVAETATRARGFDVEVTVRRLAPGEASAALADGKVDVLLSGGELRSQEEPDDEIVGIVQSASRQVRQADALRAAGLQGAELQQALNPPALKVTTVEAVDPERDRKGAFAFVAVLALYTQLLTFGYLLGSGVVEEKASRVVEVLLSAIRPRDLLAGKIIGLGLLGFGQLFVITAMGLLAATSSGALEVNGEILSAAALAVGWFVLGYVFYDGLFACAGALVPRQEELQSSMTPLTMVILVSFFISFIVLDDPDGTLAHVTSFIPFSAPMTMPPRIALGEAPAYEIVIAIAITLASAIALIPLAARIYSGAVLRTGSAIKVREAWRATAKARAESRA